MDIRSSALLTDFYQLIMLQGYLERGMEDTAVFECFVRTMPPQRGFFMAAGLAQLLEYLENVCFTPAELEWVADSGRFSRSFVDYLERFRFAGDVQAMPEGTVFFANEPVVRVTAPAASSAVDRDQAAQPSPLSDVDRIQSRTMRARCRRQTRH